MNIKTTVNVDTNKLKQLRELENLKAISLNEIILLLLLAGIKQTKHHSEAVFQRVTYQKRAKETGAEYCILHVSLPPDVYEKCIDMRKIEKLSVSYILAICINKYLDTLEYDEEPDEECDNYHEKYSLDVKQIAGNWRIIVYWGKLNEKTLQKFRL